MTGLDMYVPYSTLAILSGCAFVDRCKDHNRSGLPDPCLIKGGMRQGVSDIGIIQLLEPVIVGEVMPDADRQVVHATCNKIDLKRIEGTR